VAGEPLTTREEHRALPVDAVYDGFVRTTGARPQGWKTLDRFAQTANVALERRHDLTGSLPTGTKPPCTTTRPDPERTAGR
jgi:hypothetical protein